MVTLVFVAGMWRDRWFSSSWDDKYIFNVWLVDEENVSLWVIKNNQDAWWIRFAPNTVIPMDGKNSELKLISVDKYKKTNSEGKLVMRRSLDKWWNTISGGVFWGAEGPRIRDVLLTESNLSIRDRLKLAWWLGRRPKIKEISIEGEKEISIDEQEVVRVDVEKLLLRNREWWDEDAVRGDKRRVHLLSPQGKAWLGSVLEAAGMVVVEQDETGDDGNLCTIKVPDTDKTPQGIPEYLVNKLKCKLSDESSGDLEIELVL